MAEQCKPLTNKQNTKHTMIQANELRLGNKVLFDSDIDTVQSIFKTCVDGEYKSRWYFDRLSGIPLTAELLCKCGFTEGGDWAILTFDPRMHLRFYNFNSAECDIVQYDKFIAFKCGHLKYLHQLQNLYYCLCGTELQINLK